MTYHLKIFFDNKQFRLCSCKLLLRICHTAELILISLQIDIIKAFHAKRSRPADDLSSIDLGTFCLNFNL